MNYNLNINTERFIHSLKTTFACLIGYVITKSFEFPVDQWLLVTIIVVMCAQVSVGSVLQKASARFLGTVLGSIIAALTLLLFGSNHIAVSSAVALSAMFFSYVASGRKPFSDAGTLGATTTIVILIGKNPTIYTAITRFFEIALGIVIAALVSQFILPIHARRHLRRNQSNLIKKLSKYYEETLMSSNTVNELAMQELDEKIVNSLNVQRTLSKEATRESLGQFDLVVFKKILWCEKEIVRCIGFMRYFHLLSPSSKELLSSHIQMQSFHGAILDTLNNVSIWLGSKNLEDIKIDIPQLKQLKEIVTVAIKKLSVEDDIYLCAFLFFAETLIHRLQELVILVKELRISKKEAKASGRRFFMSRFF